VRSPLAVQVGSALFQVPEHVGFYHTYKYFTVIMRKKIWFCMLVTVYVWGLITHDKFALSWVLKWA
jgi:hypothetical protein